MLGPARDLVARLIPSVGAAPQDNLSRSQLTGAGARPDRTAQRERSAHAGDRGSALGRPLDARPRGLPRPEPARRSACSLVVTFRSDEVDRTHPLRRAAHRVGARPRAFTRIELERFGREEVRRQLAGILGTSPSPPLSTSCTSARRATRSCRGDARARCATADPRGLPPSLRDVLLARVDRLDQPQQVLRLAPCRALRARTAARRRGRLTGELSPRCARRSSSTCWSSTSPGTATRSGTRSRGTRSTTTCCPASGRGCTPRTPRCSRATRACARRTCRSPRRSPALLRRARPPAGARGVGRGGREAAAGWRRARRAALERALEIWPRVPTPPSAADIDRRGAAARGRERVSTAGALDRSLALFHEALAELRTRRPSVARCCWSRGATCPPRTRRGGAGSRAAAGAAAGGAAQRARAVVFTAWRSARPRLRRRPRGAPSRRWRRRAASAPCRPGGQRAHDARVIRRLLGRATAV